MLDINLGAALVAGLLSFISPCVLPIVPPYLSYLAGVSVAQMEEGKLSAASSRRIVATSVAFVCGFTTVFVAFGATASLLGQVLARYAHILSVVAGVAIGLMGLHFMGLLRIPILYRESRPGVTRKPAGLIGAYVMGLAFAFGWTPCVGPALAAILFIAGAQETAWQGAGLLAVYALGIGIPFVLAGLFAGRFMRWAANFRRNLRRVEQVMGAFLVLTGILFITGQMSRVAQWMLDMFPAFATIG